jgi:hypothetical protein
MRGNAMEHVMYRRVVLPAKDAADGETCAAVFVTHERNGYVVWTEGYHQGHNALGFWSLREREEAIEHAVDLAAKYRASPTVRSL